MTTYRFRVLLALVSAGRRVCRLRPLSRHAVDTPLSTRQLDRARRCSRAASRSPPPPSRVIRTRPRRLLTAVAAGRSPAGRRRGRRRPPPPPRPRGSARRTRRRAGRGSRRDAAGAAAAARQCRHPLGGGARVWMATAVPCDDRRRAEPAGGPRPRWTAPGGGRAGPSSSAPASIAAAASSPPRSIGAAAGPCRTRVAAGRSCAPCARHSSSTVTAPVVELGVRERLDQRAQPLGAAVERDARVGVRLVDREGPLDPVRRQLAGRACRARSGEPSVN